MKNLSVLIGHFALVSILLVVCLLSQAGKGFAQQNSAPPIPSLPPSPAAQAKARDLADRASQESRSGNYEQAISDASAAIDLDPDYYYFAYAVRGFCYLYTARYADAITDETKVIELKPDYVDAYYSRGVAYDHLQRWEDAIDDYQMTLVLDPSNANAAKALRAVVNDMDDDKLAKIVSSRGAVVTSSSNTFNAQQIKLDAVLNANPGDAAACQAIARFIPYLDNLNRAMRRVDFVRLINPTNKIDVAGNIDIINDNERIVANKMTFINVQKIRFKCQP